MLGWIVEWMFKRDFEQWEAQDRAAWDRARASVPRNGKPQAETWGLTSEVGAFIPTRNREALDFLLPLPQ